MFEFGRELMKLIAGERARPFADGLTGGDSTLLELLDLNLLMPLNSAGLRDKVSPLVGIEYAF